MTGSSPEALWAGVGSRRRRRRRGGGRRSRRRGRSCAGSCRRSSRRRRSSTSSAGIVPTASRQSDWRHWLWRPGAEDAVARERRVHHHRRGVEDVAELEGAVREVVLARRRPAGGGQLPSRLVEDVRAEHVADDRLRAVELARPDDRRGDGSPAARIRFASVVADDVRALVRAEVRERSWSRRSVGRRVEEQGSVGAVDPDVPVRVAIDDRVDASGSSRPAWRGLPPRPTTASRSRSRRRRRPSPCATHLGACDARQAVSAGSGRSGRRRPPG